MSSDMQGQEQGVVKIDEARFKSLMAGVESTIGIQGHDRIQGHDGIPGHDRIRRYGRIPGHDGFEGMTTAVMELSEAKRLRQYLI